MGTGPRARVKVAGPALGGAEDRPASSAAVTPTSSRPIAYAPGRSHPEGRPLLRGPDRRGGGQHGDRPGDRGAGAWPGDGGGRRGRGDARASCLAPEAGMPGRAGELTSPSRWTRRRRGSCSGGGRSRPSPPRRDPHRPRRSRPRPPDAVRAQEIESPDRLVRLPLVKPPGRPRLDPPCSSQDGAPGRLGLWHENRGRIYAGCPIIP